MDLETTIVAISSAPSRAKRGLLRVSGNNAIKGAKSVGLSPTFGSLRCDSLTIEDSTLPVLVAAFPKGSSYTGDDLIEIQFPGNQLLAKKLVALLIKATGGRQATAGEFTARAFFSGRISLSQAEGVSASISASNSGELSGAALLREGILSKLTDPITKKLTKTLALLEAGIDFTDEEDVETISQLSLTAELDHAINALRKIVDHSIPMASLRNLPRVVLAGKPNAGKSTLFNALVGTQRVVVDSASGTTRDAIEEQVSFCGNEAMLVDIAGLNSAEDELANSAQITAQTAIESADLILWCVGPADQDPTFSEGVVIVRTKSDERDDSINAICAITGEGLDRITKQIANQLQTTTNPSAEAVALLPRHEECLQNALLSLLGAQESVDTEELCAACLRDTLQSLGKITGRISPDDVLDHVFSSFCVGK
ncbi:50S ribosome-binding GTPase [PVC group bacterium]|nr:50S ribosome-binding GTPase [PVC group bacterium]